jgi:HAE1 family hydrophobic/amphiphilic exporter-1
MSLTITFKLGTDLDKAQVLVQNRVSIALPRLPEEVQPLGVTTDKSSPDLMMVVHLLSPSTATTSSTSPTMPATASATVLVRLEGVGDVILFGERQYSMRIWLDPEKLCGLRHDLGRCRRNRPARPERPGLRRQDRCTAVTGKNAFEYTVRPTAVSDVREFRYVIVKSTTSGRLVQLQDVARIELGAQDYVTNSYLNNDPAVALGIFARPGTNALDTADQIQAIMENLKKDFPPGLEYRIVYDTTEFISDSISEVYKTIAEAAILVAIVVLVFLQSWRTALIPIIAIPVSLIGTFAVLLAFGFSLNMLTCSAWCWRSGSSSMMPSSWSKTSSETWRAA